MVASITRTIPPGAPKAPPPVYHSKCQGVFYRRFVSSISLIGIVCYVEAFLISSKRNLLWSLFYESAWKGFFLWVACISVAFHRLDYFRATYPRAPSAAIQIQRLLGTIDTYYAIGLHLFSSWIIVQLYMLTSTDGMDLGIVTEGKTYERPRLNEKVLYMTWLSVWMAVIQTYYRLAVHQDRIELATVAVRARDDSIVSSITDTIQVSPRLVLQREVKSILTKAGLQALWAATSGMIPYCFFRRAVFGFTSAIVRNFYRINKSNVPHSWPVGPSFFVRTFWVSFLVFFLWEVVHATFKINYSKEPLIDGKTISESSTDPNGTLVSGLKSHRPFTKAVALWELVYITYNLPARRKNILMDIIRPTAITPWMEISDVCLANLKKMTDGLKASCEPVPTPPPPSSPPPHPQLPTSNLPSILRNPDDPFIDTPHRSRIPRGPEMMQIQATSPEHTAYMAAKKVADAIGPHTGKLDIPAQQANLVDHMNSLSNWFLDTYPGRLFRQTIDRQTSKLIPNPNEQVDSIAALSRLVTAAITEDEFGQVQRTLPAVFEQLLLSMDVLEDYIKDPPRHWTDIEFEESRKRMKEPEVVLRALKAGVREIAEAYRLYLGGMELRPWVERRFVEVAKRGRGEGGSEE